MGLRRPGPGPERGSVGLLGDRGRPARGRGPGQGLRRAAGGDVRRRAVLAAAPRARRPRGEVVASFDLDALPAAQAPPLAPGRYASFGGLAEGEVLAVWASGESGSCPVYLRGVRVRGRDVDVDVRGTGQEVCTADYNPYRQLVVLERALVPAPEALPVVDHGDDPGSRADTVVVDVHPAP